jgi:hypothetical protein
LFRSLPAALPRRSSKGCDDNLEACNPGTGALIVQSNGRSYLSANAAYLFGRSPGSTKTRAVFTNVWISPAIR